jgi:Uma2 family endonuclease
MAIPATTLVSPQEYLEFEEQSEERHEYIDGIIRPMLGSLRPSELRRHNDVAGNIYTALRPIVRQQKCSIAYEGIKLWVPAIRRYYYPDVMVSCDSRETDEKICQYPCFVTEVFSPSTKLTDRREKLQAYQTIETLQGYLMVDHEENYVEYLERTPTDWTLTRLESGEITIFCLKTTLKLEDIFA